MYVGIFSIYFMIWNNMFYLSKLYKFLKLHGFIIKDWLFKGYQKGGLKKSLIYVLKD